MRDYAKTRIKDHQAKPAYRFLREPTLHFLLLALIIFLVFEITSPTEENSIEINRVEIEARVLMLELSSGREATEQERQDIEKAYVEEQILVAQARQLGLQNDARIEDILAQKMRHVLSGEVIQPTDQELSGYYQLHAARYQSEPSVTVVELILDNEAPNAELLTLLANDGSLDAVAQLSSAPLDLLPALSQIDVSVLFDEEFGTRVFAAEVGQWLGPFPSNRGQHWLLLRNKTTTELPALADIQDRVRLDWIADEEDNKLQQEIDQMRSRYSISIIEPDVSH